MFKYLLAMLLTISFVLTANDKTEEIDKLMKQFNNEPKVEAVIKHALKYADFKNGRYGSWRTRAKNKAWLPRFYVKGRILQTNKDGLEQDDLNLGSYDTMDRDITKQRYIELKADFDFRDLIFNDDEIKADKEILSSVKARKKLIENITKLYFDRRKNQINLIVSPPKNAKTALKIKLKIEEQTAVLDALTHGFFKKNIKKKR